MKIPVKKSLGQHFLMNPATIDKILDLAQIQKSDRVLEIGPGPGAMTERLSRRAGRVVAVEKDRRFADVLRIQLTHFKNAEIVEADFLSVALEKLLGDGNPKWKVVANLPYNVATEIIFHLLEFSTFFQSFHLMVQKEVAERIAAKPGSKAYGILSVMTQIFSENRIVMKLKPGSFTPPPKVDSAVVEFKLADGCRFPIHRLETFEAVVRAAFGQRRKTIANALKGGGFSEEKIFTALKEAGVSPQARGETVSIDKFARLANAM
jgi:16S rRNA (adenine1518-N6/adenine1519-N6)-dimethyltransferase